jgi:hypothetical protein
MKCGHDEKYLYFHPSLKGSDRWRCAACEDPKGVTKFMQENPLPIDPKDQEIKDLRAENEELREIIRFFSSRYQPQLLISRNFGEEDLWEGIQTLLRKYNMGA